MTEKYDGLSELDQGEMSAEPIKERSDEVSRVVERAGDFPNTLGPVGGRTRTTLERYAVDPSDGAVPEGDLGELDDAARDELARYAKEGQPVNEVTSWTESGEGTLPAAGPQPRVED